MQQDQHILSLYQARAEEAIAETKAAYGAGLRALAQRISGSREDAEEVEQDVYLTVWNQIPPDSPRSLSAYLKTICRRRAMDKLEERSAAKRGGGESTLVLEELAESLPAQDGRHWAAQMSLQEALSRFLKELPLRERQIFLQRYWYFYPLKDIARAQGLKENHVKVLLYRLRGQLKAHLEKEGLWDE